MRMPRINFNWKYIIGEILLIFVGINLAIWFNNWNASIESNRDKQVAITKIKEEIQNNVYELTTARKKNQLFLDAFEEYEKVFPENSNEVITTSAHFEVLQNSYPGFFRPTDTIAMENGLFLYRGQTYINLELAELTEIAWETTRSIGITNEFNYECLFELEGMYNLQRRVKKETDRTVDILQQQDIQKLMKTLKFLQQFEDQLELDYEKMLEMIDDCR